jgi:enoyl-CoA hydratase/carnithine racemase
MLKISKHGPVAEILLDRPPVNAMNIEFLDALIAAHTEVIDEGARAVVIVGREGLFSAGLDVRELMEADRQLMGHFWNRFFALMSALAASPVPVVAAITGHAPAGGAVLALHCDYRVATRGEFRIGLNEVQVGLPVPPNILYMLELVVGARQAMLLASTGALLTPDEALQVGLVDQLAEPGRALADALDWCQQILLLPPQAMNTTRRAARAAVIERAAANERYAETATDYWFSEETQRLMGQLVASLSKK